MQSKMIKPKLNRLWVWENVKNHDYHIYDFREIEQTVYFMEVELGYSLRSNLDKIRYHA